MQQKITDINIIDPEKLQVLDRIAELLSDPDNNLEELSLLYKNHKFLQSTGQKFKEWLNDKQL